MASNEMLPALPPLFRNVDVHTHSHAHIGPDAIVCLTPTPADDAILHAAPANALFSIGIHPWQAQAADADTWKLLQQMSTDARVVAIGECGLDARRGPAMDVQIPVFEAQAHLAEQMAKPLIIHAVAAWQHVIALKHKIKPTQPWIIHGFRGKPQLASQLATCGLYLSLGPRHNLDVPRTIPSTYLLHETDTPS